MKKILLVDDDPDMLNSVQSILMKEDYETQIVLEWEKMYKKVRIFKPDLIILDVHLDGVDGRILCRNLKNSEDTKHIPVIVCSAHFIAGNSIHEYGADSFIAKPFFIDQLLNKVKQCVGNNPEHGTKTTEQF